jgi:valyl-tRNA synthetase
MEPPERPDPAELSLADRWIISRLDSVTASVDHLLRTWQLGEAGRQIQEFLWGDYCDWYIEIAKVDLYGEDEARKAAVADVLVYVLERALRLLHPYMPFVTEAIWQYLPHQGEALIVAPWPTAEPADESVETLFGSVMEIIRAIRNVRAEYKVDPGRRIQAVVAAGGFTDLLRSQAPIISSLARVDEEQLTIAESVEPVKQSATVVTPEVTVYLPLAGMVDLDAERERLRKEIADTERELAHARGLLGNPNFTERAPAAVVERERTREAQAAEKLEGLRRRLEDLS